MPWRRNLVFIWLSQFLSIMGFAFAMPFAPYYIQELGVTDPVKVKLWVSVFAAATPLSLSIFSPIWGALGDRYGRRLMLLRANLGATVVLALMGSAHSVLMLVILRFCQGAFTGTVTAAQAMVASHTPEKKSGFALGSLSASVFSGVLVGASLGGLFADAYGYRATFFVASGFTFLATLCVLFGTREQVIDRSESETGAIPPHSKKSVFSAAVPILFLMFCMGFVRQFDMAMTPILVQEIHGGLDGVSFWTGMLFAIASVAGLLSGLTLGRLADRVSPPLIGMIAACLAAVLMIPQGLAQGFGLLFVSRFGMIFFSGGLDPILQIWLAKTTPEKRRGFIFGWAATARYLGWMGAPMISGAIAAMAGVRMVYFIGAGLFIVFALILGAVSRRSRKIVITGAVE